MKDNTMIICCHPWTDANKGNGRYLTYVHVSQIKLDFIHEKRKVLNRNTAKMKRMKIYKDVNKICYVGSGANDRPTYYNKAKEGPKLLRVVGMVEDAGGYRNFPIIAHGERYKTDNEARQKEQEFMDQFKTHILDGGLNEFKAVAGTREEKDNRECYFNFCRCNREYYIKHTEHVTDHTHNS